MNAVVFVETGSLEWQRMWASLTAHPLNAGLADGWAAKNPLSLESWQYMGTRPRAGVVQHNFRHRDHPVSGKREYLWLDAGPQPWAPVSGGA